MTDHTLVDRSEFGYDCACGWSGTYSRDVHFDTAANQHAAHLARVLPPAEGRA
jgi:hypothetical protein